MKTQNTRKIVGKLLLIVLTVIAMNNTVSADPFYEFKKQCQFVVYGNGSFDPIYAGMQGGIIEGIRYTIPYDDLTELGKKFNFNILTHKACQSALNDLTSDGFNEDYKRHVLMLLSKSH